MDRDTCVVTRAAVAATILMPMVCLAQAPPQSQTPVSPKTEQLDAKVCADVDTDGTVGLGGDARVREPSSGSPSDRLARSGGVICPPEHVDSEIRQPTPPGGVMPVIPPPGGPGGDRAIQPK